MQSISVDNRCLRTVVVLAACCLNTRAIVANEESAIIKTACQKGTESLARLEVDAASWTITRPGVPYASAIDVVRHGKNYRWITKSADGKELCRVICRDGVWYVVNGNRKSGKFRPFEATLISPSSYAQICQSNPRPAQDLFPMDALSLKTSNEAHIVLKGPLMGTAQEMFDTLEATLKAALNRDPDNSQAKESLEEITNAKKAGMTITVDRASGFVLGIDCDGEPSVCHDRLQMARQRPRRRF